LDLKQLLSKKKLEENEVIDIKRLKKDIETCSSKIQ
jgi:hypothetical protein